MNKYLKEFLHRGLIFGGFGPIVTGIVFFIIEKTVDGVSFNATEMLLSIVSTYLLAFIQAGATVFNQIEDWPIPKSLFCHFVTLYVAYSLCYILNYWIPFEPMVLLIFSLIFAATFFLIWGIVYFSVKSMSKKMNSKLR
ncbi:MAG: DUF3021 domain-containing protein [Clostridia bacterium]|nr:DUF3021 domain-containing protein [Clostridia bacterium]